MADETIIIDIEVSDSEAIKAITDARQRVEELTAAKKQSEEQDGKNSESVERLTAQIKAENDIIRANQKILTDNIKTQKANEGSLNQLRSQLRNLTKQYDDLSKAEREGAKGDELLKKIQTVTEEVKTAEAASGRFQRNVGNYPKVFDLSSTTMGKFAQMAQGVTGGANSLAGAFSNAGKGVAAMGKQLLSLLANPIVAIIAGIAAVVMQLAKAFKSSDDAGTALQSGLSALKPIVDFVKKAFVALAESVGKAVEWIGKGVSSLLSWIPGYKEAAAAEMDLVKATDRLQEAERQYTVQHAQREAQVSELRNKANDAERYSAKQREGFLNQAIRLEKEDLKARMVIAKEKLRLAQLEAKMNSDTSDETKNKLAELQAAVYAAEKEYNDGTRRLEKQAQSFRDEQRKAAAEAAKKAEADRKERAAKELAESRALEDALFAAMIEGADKQKAQLKAQTQRQIEDLRRRLTDEKNLTEKARADINERIILMQANLQIKLGEIDKEAEKQRLSDMAAAATDFWAARVALATKGSEEEREARESALQEALKQEISALNERLVQGKITAEQYETMLAAVKKKGREQQLAIEREQAKHAADVVALEWQNRINATIEGSSERARLEMEMRKQQLDELHQMEGESDAEFMARQLAAKKSYDDAVKALDKSELDAASAKATAIGDITASVSGFLEAAAGENKELAQAAKILALGEVAVKQGVAIANGVASAMAVPFPANLGAIATVVGAVLTTMTSALNTINSAQFATGGYIQGAGTGTSDSIVARVSNGESVINAKSTAKYYDLLSAINQDGGGVAFSGAVRRSFATGGMVNVDTLASVGRTEELVRSMRDAVANIHPVVSVREIAKVSGRVEVKEKIAKTI